MQTPTSISASPSFPNVPSTTPYAQLWENETFLLRMNGASDDQSGQQESMISWGSMQQNFNLNAAILSDTDLLEPPSWLPTPVMSDQSTDAAMIMTMSSAALGDRLITLIAKMQHSLQVLEHGPWQNDSSNNLDDYPVGTVLHLCEELDSIASPVLSQGRLVGRITPRECIAAIDNPSGAEAHSTKLKDMDGDSDTVAALLVLSGYMSLARIYSTVLGQFQAHLSNVSSSNNMKDCRSMHSASTNPTLQLGELPCTTAAPILGKIHTALHMLLAALHGVEEKLGPGGAVARNLVVVLLAQEAVVGTSEFDCGLWSKMQSMKELLQEKMNM